MQFYTYRASAGSGKTFTLVKEYIKTALRNDNPFYFRHILAITFTNKAAAEMKERIIRMLKAFASSEENLEPEMMKMIMAELSLSSKVIKRRAESTLASVLHHYSDFSISTIDAFTNRIAKTFAHDLHLPVNFSVSLDQDELLLDAVGKIMEKAGENTEITEILLGYSEALADDEKSMRIADNLTELGKELFKEGGAKLLEAYKNIHPQEIIEARKTIIASMLTLENKVAKLGNNAIELIEAAGLNASTFFQKDKGVYGFFVKCMHMNESKSMKINAHVLKTLNDDKWVTHVPNKIETQLIDNLRPILHALNDIYSNSYRIYIIQRLLSPRLFSLALLGEIARNIDQKRDVDGIVHISEFNKRISDIVLNESAPFIFERLGDKYHHFLVDEFQDTSVLQWQNLLPLIHNGLSEGHESLIVGDGKQAIYRWRGGDVEQFSKLPEPHNTIENEVQLERYATLKRTISSRSLDTNFRSAPEIIEFNNFLYNLIPQAILPEDLRIIYENQAQKTAHESKKGHVWVEFHELPSRDDPQDLYDKLLESSLNKLNELFEKGVKPSEVTFLVRKNDHGVKIANYLLKNNIQVVSGESLLVHASRDVRFLISWLKLLNDDNRSVQITHIIHYLLNHLGGTFDQYKNWLNADNQSLNNFLNQHGFTVELEIIRSKPALEICHSLIRIFNISYNDNAYLQSFINDIWTQSKSGLYDLTLYLERWAEKFDKISISMPPKSNAVTIMTVHKSKGLEFPYVFIPFAIDARGLNSSMWFENTLEELPKTLPYFQLNRAAELLETPLQEIYERENELDHLDTLNLLYVATTRAEKGLFIFSTINKGDKNGWGSYLFKQINPDVSETKPLIWHSGEFVYESNKGVSEIESAYKWQPYKGNGWNNKIFFSKNSSRYWDTGEEPEAIRFGNLVHTLLSEINVATDLTKVVQTAHLNGFISLEEVHEIEHLMLKIINHQKLKVLFEPGYLVYNERELLLLDGSIKRPDRVNIANNQVFILDYKSGKQRAEHVSQMKIYSNAFKAMGYSGITAYIVYLQKDIVVEQVLV